MALFTFIEAAVGVVGFYRGLTTGYFNKKDRLVDAGVVSIISISAVLGLAGFVYANSTAEELSKFTDSYEFGTISIFAGSIFLDLLAIGLVGLSLGSVARSWHRPDLDDD